MTRPLIVYGSLLAAYFVVGLVLALRLNRLGRIGRRVFGLVVLLLATLVPVALLSFGASHLLAAMRLVPADPESLAITQYGVFAVLTLMVLSPPVERRTAGWLPEGETRDAPTRPPQRAGGKSG